MFVLKVLLNNNKPNQASRVLLAVFSDVPGLAGTKMSPFWIYWS